MELRFDPDALSLGDIEEFEDYTGFMIDHAFDENKKPRSSKVMTALVWILRRQEDPNYTIEDARKVRPADIKLDAGNPTPAAPTPMPQGGKRKRAAS